MASSILVVGTVDRTSLAAFAWHRFGINVETVDVFETAADELAGIKDHYMETMPAVLPPDGGRGTEEATEQSLNAWVLNHLYAERSELRLIVFAQDAYDHLSDILMSTAGLHTYFQDETQIFVHMGGNVYDEV